MTRSHHHSRSTRSRILFPGNEVRKKSLAVIAEDCSMDVSAAGADLSFAGPPIFCDDLFFTSELFCSGKRKGHRKEGREIRIKIQQEKDPVLFVGAGACGVGRPRLGWACYPIQKDHRGTGEREL